MKKAVREQIIRLYPSTPDEKLLEMFDVDEKQLDYLRRRYVLFKSKKFFKDQKEPRWTAEETELMRCLYPCTPTMELARMFTRSAESIRSKAKRMKIVKEFNFKSEQGRQAAKKRRKSATQILKEFRMRLDGY